MKNKKNTGLELDELLLIVLYIIKKQNKEPMCRRRIAIKVDIDGELLPRLHRWRIMRRSWENRGKIKAGKRKT